MTTAQCVFVRGYLWSDLIAAVYGCAIGLVILVVLAAALHMNHLLAQLP